MKKVFLILLSLIAFHLNALALDEISPDEKQPLEIKSLKLDNEFAEKDTLKKENKSESESEKINSLNSDVQKVKEWAKLSKSNYYIIIDKKECSATVCSKDGSEIDTFEVGIGRDIGDDFNDTSGLLGKPRNTTPAGEFTLITNIYNTKAYGDVTFSLGRKANKAQKSKKMVALHKVPKFRQERLNKFYDGNMKNNRMSHGCINFLERDFKEVTKYIKGGFTVYILPEEEGNQLVLAKNDKGEFELVQTKH